MWRICLPVDAPPEEQHCFNIPVILLRWPWEPPDPRPDFSKIDWVAGPDPSPWRNLSVLATIDQVSRYASDDLGQALRDVVHEHAKSISAQLPRVELKITEAQTG